MFWESEVQLKKRVSQGNCHFSFTARLSPSEQGKIVFLIIYLCSWFLSPEMNSSVLQWIFLRLNRISAQKYSDILNISQYQFSTVEHIVVLFHIQLCMQWSLRQILSLNFELFQYLYLPSLPLILSGESHRQFQAHLTENLLLEQ